MVSTNLHHFYSPVSIIRVKNTLLHCGHNVHTFIRLSHSSPAMCKGRLQSQLYK